MSLFRVFDVAGSAMQAQSMRLNTVASNMANADSATSASGAPYKAKQVVFQAVPMATGSSAQVNKLQNQSAVGVKVQSVVESSAPFRLAYEPGHPLADAQGYVRYPNVDVVEEMTNMISASRAYQTNAEMMNTAKTLLLRTLALAQG